MRDREAARRGGLALWGAAGLLGDDCQLALCGEPGDGYVSRRIFGRCLNNRKRLTAKTGRTCGKAKRNSHPLTGPFLRHPHRRESITLSKREPPFSIRQRPWMLRFEGSGLSSSPHEFADQDGVFDPLANFDPTGGIDPPRLYRGNALRDIFGGQSTCQN